MLLKYSINASSTSKNDASVNIKQTSINFGTTSESSDKLANPAELLLASLSACILKNVERFSDFMKFEFSHAEISVSATRFEKPPRIDEIHYVLKIFTQDDNLNIPLLKKNIEKFGTIYNTVSLSSKISGEIEKIII